MASEDDARSEVPQRPPFGVALHTDKGVGIRIGLVEGIIKSERAVDSLGDFNAPDLQAFCRAPERNPSFVDRSGDGSIGVIVDWFKRAPDGEHGIPDELVDYAARCCHFLDDRDKIKIEKPHDLAFTPHPQLSSISDRPEHAQASRAYCRENPISRRA